MLEKIHNNKIRIVIIDSGIDLRINNLNENVIIQKSYSLDSFGNVIVESSDKIANNHGTIIASTIKYLCNNIEIISLGILNENLAADFRMLIYALRESLEYSPQIVHLSLGTKKLKYWYQLKKVINKLNKNNVVIVASTSNDKKTTFPAYYKNVIGVKSGRMIHNLNDFYYKRNYFYAPSRVPSYIWDGDHRNIFGNSIATAYITGHICNVIDKTKLMSCNDITKYMKYIGKNNYYLIKKY